LYGLLADITNDGDMQSDKTLRISKMQNKHLNIIILN